MTDDRSGASKTRRGLAGRVAVVAVLAIAVAAVLYVKGTQSGSASDASEQVAAQGALPRLVDLGSDKCVPCKMMAPILAELQKEYADRFETIVIDVWKTYSEAQKYGVQVIPTQVFFDAEGNELSRHEGFLSREDILKTWQRHGFDFGPIEKPEKSENTEDPSRQNT